MRALLAARHTGVGRPAGLTVSAQGCRRHRPPQHGAQIQSAGSLNIASYGSWPLSGNRIVAGTPVATAPAGMSLTTTELAPICTWSPMYTGPRIRAPAPIVTLLPIVGCRLTRSIERPPRVTP